MPAWRWSYPDSWASRSNILSKSAAHRLQPLHLLDRLNTFGDHVHFERPRQVEDRPYDPALSFSSAIPWMNERSIFSVSNG
jgi:hypothetical protein